MRDAHRLRVTAYGVLGGGAEGQSSIPLYAPRGRKIGQEACPNHNAHGDRPPDIQAGKVVEVRILHRFVPEERLLRRALGFAPEKRVWQLSTWQYAASKQKECGVGTSSSTRPAPWVFDPMWQRPSERLLPLSLPRATLSPVAWRPEH